MWRSLLYTSLIILLLHLSGTRSALALSEADVQATVSDLQVLLAIDWGPMAAWEADPARCGGLLDANDPIVDAYYNSQDPFTCRVKDWCTKYDSSADQCVGEKCVITYTASTWSFGSGTLLDCTSVPCSAFSPPRTCDNRGISLGGPGFRTYDCGYLQAPFNWIPKAKAECIDHNCLLEYLSSPVLPSDPKGELALIPTQIFPPHSRAGAGAWETTLGSNVSTESSSSFLFPRDSSFSALELDFGHLSPQQGVKHNVADQQGFSPLHGLNLNPPHVRLILPKGSYGVEHEGSPLFTRLFSSLGNSSQKTPVEKIIGNEPDALRTAAEYLRSIPLLEVEYEPVSVLVPTASTVLLQQLQDEWRVYLADLQQKADEQSLTVDPQVVSTIQGNIIAMQSYQAVQETIRDYRSHFPRYVDALLTYVEEVNTFFRTQWIEENANRLDGWFLAYSSYLPQLQSSLTLFAATAEDLSDCLASACRKNVFPVAGTTPGGDPVRPWDLVPEDVNVYPQNNVQDSLWYRQLVALPDITLDLSEIFLDTPIQIPVLKIEPHQLNVPYPPPLDADDLEGHLAGLPRLIRPLPELTPPLFDFTFPALSLPDPTTSLFVIPEPPLVLPGPGDLSLWLQPMHNTIQRMQYLRDMCDPSPQPRLFMAYENQLLGGKDPGAVKAAAYINGTGTTIVGSGTPGGRFIRQHLQLDTSWEEFQDQLLRAVDTWNAQVKFASIVPRSELLREDSDYRRHSGVPKDSFRTNE